MHWLRRAIIIFLIIYFYTTMLSAPLKIEILIFPNVSDIGCANFLFLCWRQNCDEEKQHKLVFRPPSVYFFFSFENWETVKLFRTMSILKNYRLRQAFKTSRGGLFILVISVAWNLPIAPKIIEFCDRTISHSQPTFNWTKIYWENQSVWIISKCVRNITSKQ